MHAGRIIVYVFVSCCVIALAVSLWLGFTKRGEARENQSILGLRKIHEKAQRWAREHGGDYPDHMARLLTWSSVSPPDFMDPREPDDSAWTIGVLNVRTLPLGSDEASDVSDTQTRLDAAIQSFGHPVSYRFGDFFFARLAQPTGDGRIVFGWTIRGVGGRRFMMFDNGKGQRIEPDEWPIIWEADATARAALGLPTIEPPAYDS